MDKRWIFTAGLVPALLLGSAEAGESPAKQKTAEPAARARKLNVKIEVPWFKVLAKPEKHRPVLPKKGIHEPGDYWNPEMLDKVRRVNR